MGKQKAERTVYHRIRQARYAEEFLERCIQKTRTVYGLNEKQTKKLLRDMGL